MNKMMFFFLFFLFFAQSVMAAATNETEPWSQQVLFNQAINLFLAEGDAQSAANVVKDHFPNDPMLVLGTLVSMNDFEAAQAKITTFATDIQAKDIVSMFQVLVDLGIAGKSIIELDISQEATLWAVANSNSPAQYSAQNILTFAKGYSFVHPVEVWDGQNLEEGGSDRDALGNNVVPQTLSLSPNPTNGEVTVHWNPSEGNGTIRVMNLTGQVLFEQKVALPDGVSLLSLQGTQPGIYLIRLGSLTRKLIIE